jgi:DNA-binding SARP family transcriptional activator
MGHRVREDRWHYIMVAMSVIRFSALGGFELHDAAGSPIAGVLSQPKRAALFAHLVLAQPRRAHPRDTIVALFWPDLDEARARNALSQAIHFLRRALGNETFIAHDGDVVSVDFRRVWCDALVFDDAVQQRRLDEALDLYKGNLLDGFHASAGAEFERWLDVERDRLKGRYVEAVTAIAQRREKEKDFAGAVQHWRRLAAHDPCNSIFALGLMRALAAAGDPAGAVKHGRQHKALLRKELDVGVPAEIMALIQDLQPTPTPVPRKPDSDV